MRAIIEFTLVMVLTCDSDFSDVGRVVSNGGLVVFPTDTVYGVGSNPLSQSGLLRCFDIKNRSVEKKLPILFSSVDEVSRFVRLDDLTLLIIRKFWPGKVTLILPANEINIPSELIGHDRTLAVRIPRHTCCRRLIDACSGSLLGTSANVSGQPPFVDPADPALLEFASKADYYVKGKCGTDKLASTVLDLSKKGQVVVKREGAVSRRQIADYLEKTSSTDFSFSIASN